MQETQEIKENINSKNRNLYTEYYEKLKIKENEVLLQSFGGKSISGNVYYILKELCKNKKYSNLKKYVVAKSSDLEKIKEFINKKKFTNVEIVKLHSKKYCKKLAEVKYLINNTAFPTYFIKKKGQIYLNTWQGTCIEGQGRNQEESKYTLGNTQRNILMSDYLLMHNDFTLNNIKKDFMLDNIFKGKYIITGQPKNSVLFNNELREKIRNKLDIDNKRVVAYMPVLRTDNDEFDVEKQKIYVMYYLYELETKLDENTIVYVKLNDFIKQHIKKGLFKKIKPFPKEYEEYEFLTAVDCLITDYSNVLFDYSNTKRKIVLFPFDKEKYIGKREFYLKYDELPFKTVQTIDELAKEISDSNYKEYNEFIDKYNYNDNKDLTKKICDYIFNQKKENEFKVIERDKFFK